MTADVDGLSDRLLECLRDLRNVVRVLDVVEQDDELVAAEAGDDVAGAQAGLESCRDDEQELVADQVAMSVVDHLEAVQVEEEDRETPLATPAVASQRLIEKAGEHVAVGEPRQIVVERPESELLDRHAPLAADLDLGQLPAGREIHRSSSAKPPGEVVVQNETDIDVVEAGRSVQVGGRPAGGRRRILLYSLARGERRPMNRAERRRATDMTAQQPEELLKTLKARFEKNMNRHKGLEWAKIQAKLEADAGKLRSLGEMERTGGEPDVVGHDRKTGEYIFYDCSAESPKGRRSVCYDREGLESRKEHKPKSNAIDMAAAMGIELLTEVEYRELQKSGNFDTKTSSWVKTPSDIRELGGALFCDRRYGHVFVYHNGAQSYYLARGFRGSLRV